MDRGDGPSVFFDNIAVDRLRESRIIHLSHKFDLTGALADEVAAWRRLRSSG